MNLRDRLFCVMDTETTGTDPLGGDRIIEIAIVPVYKQKILYRSIYSSLVNPKIKIPAVVERVHKISNQDIENAPVIDEVFEKMRTFMRKSIMVFHRAEFDLTFVDISAKEIGIFPPTVNYIDTREMSMVLFGEKKTLSWLAQKFGYEKPTHRALDDALVTAKVFIKMLNQLTEPQVLELLHNWRGQEW